MSRPNFLLIMTDQHRADHLGCYGNPIVQTPNIDALAACGTRFEQFYVNCPICMPNRIAMMTARMPTTNGSRHNGIPMDREAVSYVDLLRAAGYRTGLVGKCHLQDMTDRVIQPDPAPQPPGLTPPPEPLSDARRERRIGAGWDAEVGAAWKADPNRQIALPYYGFDHVRFADGHGDDVYGHYTGWARDKGVDIEALRGPANAIPDNRIAAPQTWRSAVPEELYSTSFVADETCAFLDAQADADQPFFLHCSFPDPHHPFGPPGRYFDLYDPDAMPLPESFDAVGQGEHPYIAWLRDKAARGDSWDQGPPPFAVTDMAAMRQMIALTYGMITMVDDAIGRILARLDALGLRENTVVIFTSDHGDLMGDHGLMLKHAIHYDGVLRVPFIWSDCAPDHPGGKTPLGCSIDIGPTILARAGLAAHNGAQGIDLFGDPALTGLDRRKGILVEEDELGAHLAAPQGTRTRSFVTDRWRLTLYDGFEGGDLYDRRTDPLELRNLWDDPAHAADKARLIEAMLRERIRLDDRAPRSVHIA
ncbi:MAG: sulfatase-like hydrolase/transferase [Rhodobacteraceae bacterium]|nr:sulfatase-like hydrolase/transferase [Paracoccaceae bacterium]